MAAIRPTTFQPGQFGLLTSAFEHATRELSKAENIPAIKACLAHKMLVVIAIEKSDPFQLSDAALAAMRECLHVCTGCKPHDTRVAVHAN